MIQLLDERDTSAVVRMLADQNSTLRNRVERLEKQLDDTLKRLGDDTTAHKRCQQLLSLREERIQFLESELEIWEMTQDEGVGG